MNDNNSEEEYLFNDENIETGLSINNESPNENIEINSNENIESEHKLYNDKFTDEENDWYNNENIENEQITNNNFINEENDLYDNKSNKKSIIKYILIGAFSAIIVLIILIFIPKDTAISKESIEKQMKESSKQYFDKYMSINNNTNEYVVTLEMLENANKQGEKYNLKGLEKCKKQTTISRIIVNFKTKETKKIEVELNC